MPVLRNSIHDFYFEDLQGSLLLQREELELFFRPGIDGVGARKTGLRGRPFMVESVHYVADWEAARDALVAYQGLIGADPVDVYHHDVYWGQVLVETVALSPGKTRACYNVTGSIVANPQVLQFCTWRLVGVT